LPSFAPFPPLFFVALAATLAARLDFDVFSAIFWRFYLFSGKPCPSAGLGRCHASPLSGESGFVEGGALHSHHLCACLLPAPIGCLIADNRRLDPGAHDFHFTPAAGAA